VSTDEWFTDRWITDLAAAASGGEFDLDPFGHPDAPVTERCRLIYTQAGDGFARRWKGRLWINPPFSRSDQAWRKTEEELDSGRVRSLVGIWPESPGAAYFHGIFARCHVTFVGRLPHVNPETGDVATGPRSSVVLVGVMPWARWRAHFGPLGPTIQKGSIRLPRNTDRATVALLDEEANAAEVGREWGLSPAHARQLRQRARGLLAGRPHRRRAA